jgi:Cof subfamily protein (haloacid dehalogenase superfamily)
MKIDETLYISDLDGTLLRDDQTLSESSASFLKDAILNGLNFSYATARSVVSSKFVLDQLKINNPVILYNGAQIYCPKKNSYIHTAYLDPVDYEMILQHLIDDGLDPVVHSVDSNDNLKVYFRSASNRSITKWVNSRLKNGDKRFRLTVDFSEVNPSSVIEVMVVGSEKLLKGYESYLKSHTSLSYVLSEDIYCKDHYWLEINHFEANKGHAVEKLKSYLGLKNIVSFGDNHNDVPMFKKSTYSLAVQNAHSKVQDFASEVIGHHNDEAVIEYIKQNITNA